MSVLLLNGCVFPLEVTTQRTALENQVMGSYAELEDDLILVSSVRGKTQAKHEPVSPYKKRALDARQNQEFNRDDVDELKDKGILGEALTGSLALLHPESASQPELKLAKTLVAEENQDRATIWNRIIESNPNLKEGDLPEVKKTYAKMQREEAQKGQWVQDEDGRWEQKQ